MGSGDLNQKKSWHVDNLKNQKKVWDSEQKALAARKRDNERAEELRKERQEEEIARQLEAAGGKKRVDRVDWMYQGPGSGGDAGGMVTEEAEAFLLGKRRINAIVAGEDHKQLQKSAIDERFANAGADSALPGATPTSARDMATKIREDPLLAIKRQEQQSYEAMLNDPIRRRQMLAAMGVKDKEKDKDDDKSSRRSSHHHHHHHHHRSSHRHRDDRDRDRDRDRHRDHSRDRRRDRDRDRDRNRERGRDDDDDRRHKRRHEERSPRRDDRRRERSPRSASRTRSQSPRARRDRRDDRRSDRHERDRRPNGNPRTSGHNNSSNNSSSNSSNTSSKLADEERARKLAAMQANATDLETERSKRLAAIEAQEAAARAADEAARGNDATGSTTAFSTNLRQKAGDMGLADRLGRNRHGLVRDDD